MLETARFSTHICLETGRIMTLFPYDENLDLNYFHYSHGENWFCSMFNNGFIF